MAAQETYSPEAYNQLLDSIFSRHRSVQDAGFAGDAYKPGLERMHAFDALLGRPSAAFRSILIAGTNGKGSVASLLAASLAATAVSSTPAVISSAPAVISSEVEKSPTPGATLSVGLYTSPHLLDFRERIKILHHPAATVIPSVPTVIPSAAKESIATLIPREAVFDFLRRWEADIDRLGLTFFEITTEMAFWWFAEQHIDIAVVEVGLGGRLDSTNILSPELSIVTSIGLDHCALLGDTRAAIAAEKAGIFKPATPALVGEYDAETAPVFASRAAAVHCPLFFAPQLVPAAPSISAAELDLRGAYQERNLATVLAALTLLGVPPQPDALRHAAALTGLRGRWERLRTAPEVIADIGHNPPALRLNFAQLRAMMASGAYDRLIILYGIMADKALDDILPLFPGLDPSDRFEVRYIFTTPSTPRALPALEVLDRYERFLRSARNDSGDARNDSSPGTTEAEGTVFLRRHFPDDLRKIVPSAVDAVDAEVVEPVEEAVRRALEMATPLSLVYMGGSAFLVADVLRAAEDAPELFA